MRLRSGAAYSERPAPALPHDALCHILSFLPRGALGVTPGRVCRAWAAAKAQVWALLPPAPYDEQVRPFLPLWYARGVVGSAPVWRQHRMVNAAALHGQVDALDALVEQFWADSGEWVNSDASCFAAKAGQLGVMRWLRQHGCPLYLEVCNAAARAGQLAAVQYCREQGCAWNERTCEAAAAGGHLVVLQYCRRNGCPWDTWTCWWAAHRGYLSVLQWCVAQGCPIDVEVCLQVSQDPAYRAWLKTLLPAAQ